MHVMSCGVLTLGSPSAWRFAANVHEQAREHTQDRSGGGERHRSRFRQQSPPTPYGSVRAHQTASFPLTIAAP
jgi:hypothetical protein